MAESAQQGGKLNVFISYSRDDLAFADQLRAFLLRDFAITIDRESITAGDDWKKRLGTLILDADTIVFVLSPSSAKSLICAWEAKEAASLGKRILPVLCIPLGDAVPPPELADLNYTYFYNEPKFPGSGFRHGASQAGRRAQHQSGLVARAHALSPSRERMGGRREALRPSASVRRRHWAGEEMGRGPA
jgi:hypothetical protein